LGNNGISWTICKQSAPHSRQITTPTPHHSIFTGWMLFLTPTNSVKALSVPCLRLVHHKTSWTIRSKCILCLLLTFLVTQLNNDYYDIAKDSSFTKTIHTHISHTYTELWWDFQLGCVNANKEVNKNHEDDGREHRKVTDHHSHLHQRSHHRCNKWHKNKKCRKK